jgi:hypothetical protein
MMAGFWYQTRGSTSMPGRLARFVAGRHLEKREAVEGIVSIPRKYQSSGGLPDGKTTDRWVARLGYADGYKDFISHK